MALPVNAFNPIQNVGGVSIKCPSSYSFEWEDVSKASAGRTEDGKMHKEMIGHVLAFNLKWNALSYSEMATIINAFKPEYVTVRLLSPEDSTAFVSKVFYVGNRTGALYNTNTRVWEGLSFKIIEQSVES